MKMRILALVGILVASLLGGSALAAEYVFVKGDPLVGIDKKSSLSMDEGSKRIIYLTESERQKAMRFAKDCIKYAPKGSPFLAEFKKILKDLKENRISDLELFLALSYAEDETADLAEVQTIEKK